MRLAKIDGIEDNALEQIKTAPLTDLEETLSNLRNQADQLVSQHIEKRP